MYLLAWNKPCRLFLIAKVTNEYDVECFEQDDWKILEENILLETSIKSALFYAAGESWTYYNIEMET